MTLLLKQLYKFFKLLNSDTATNQLAAGLTLGLLIGFAPFISIQTILFLIIVFIFRVQVGAAFLSAFFFKFVAFLFDGPSHALGKVVLESDSLRPLFTIMYNIPIVPMTRFNNSIIMGSMILSFLLAPIAYYVFKILIIKYRASVLERFKQTKFWKAFSATKFYLWYCKYDDLYN